MTTWWPLPITEVGKAEPRKIVYPIVWAHRFPYPGTGAPPPHWVDKDRPFLVLEAREILGMVGHWQLLGAMGTSQVLNDLQEEGTDLLIMKNHLAFPTTRLPKATLFQFAPLSKLQYNSDYFKIPPFHHNNATPQIGGLLVEHFEKALQSIFEKADVVEQIRRLRLHR